MPSGCNKYAVTFLRLLSPYTSPMNAPDKIVAQHNALVNARFTFDPLQMRLFLALLGRIDFDDVDFQEHLIPFDELVSNSDGGSSYALVKEMCVKLTSFSIYIEDLEPVTRRRSKKPAYDYIPLMAKASYAPERGGVVAIFNPLIIPYLLQLRESGNFTLAKLAELGKLKSAYALRIYWLLKEYATFGERTITVQQLRFLLDIADKEYPRFSSLKARILDPVQKELASTDQAFTFELARNNQIVQQIKFIIDQARPVKVLKLPAASSVLTPHPGYPEKLQAAGLRPTAVREVLTQLTAEEYPVGYVDFVLTRVGKQHGLGKIKNPAGAVYKALLEKYLLPEYRAGQLESVSPVRPTGTSTAVPRSSKAVRETFTLPEVRTAYDESASFRQAQGSAETWEQYLTRVYYDRGFTREDFHGRECLVLRHR